MRMISAGLLWGGCILLLGILNSVVPPFGSSILQAISSVYPGYHASGAIGDVLVGAVYAAVDGAIAGLVLAWLYNAFAGRSAGAGAPSR